MGVPQTLNLRGAQILYKTVYTEAVGYKRVQLAASPQDICFSWLHYIVSFSQVTFTNYFTNTFLLQNELRMNISFH